MNSNKYFTVTCSFCMSAIDMPCLTKAGKSCSTHKIRIAESELAAVPAPAPATCAEYHFDVHGTDPIHISMPVAVLPGTENDRIALVAFGKDSDYIGPKPKLEILVPMVSFKITEDPTLDILVNSGLMPKQILHIISGAAGRWDRTYHAGGEGCDKDKNFRPHETRAFLEKFAPGPFAIYSEEDLKEAMKVVAYGLVSLTENGTFTGEVFTGFVKDQSGATLVLVPAGSNYTFASFKIYCRVAKETDKGKFMKYLKRLFAMYVHASFGNQQEFSKDSMGGILKYTSNGERFKVRYDSRLPKGMKIEGMAKVSLRWALAQLGPVNPKTLKPWREHDTARITFTCRKFMWKGHVVIHGLKNIDASFWDCKTVIGTHEIFVGLMGALHAGKAKMGIQEAADWPHLHDYIKQKAKDAAIAFSKEIVNPDYGIEKLKSAYTSEFNGLFGPDSDGLTASMLDKWRFMNAIAQGFDYLNNPFLIRDAYRAFQQDVLDLTNGKVPLPDTEAFRAYYMIDYFCINDDGLFDLRGRKLYGHEVYTSNLLPGQKFVTWRNPHTIHEAVIGWATETHCDCFKHIDADIMIVSVDIAMDFVEVQGGGDYDDCGNVNFCPEVVKSMDLFINRKKGTGYPQKLVKSTVDTIVDSGLDFLDEYHGVAKVAFDRRSLMSMIRAVEQSKLGLGSIDNHLRVSETFSLHLEAMQVDVVEQLAAVKAGTPEHKNLIRGQVWLTNFGKHERYEENELASFFEDAIDGKVMNGAKGGHSVNLEARINTFNKNRMITPFWETVGARSGHGRVPLVTKLNNPVVVYDPLSKLIQSLIKIGDQLDQFICRLQWKGLTFAPLAIANMIISEEVVKATITQKKLWNAALGGLSLEGLAGKEWYNGFIAICNERRAFLDSKGYEFSMQFMAVLERNVYDGTYDVAPVREGRNFNVADAYLNNPKMFSLRVELYKHLGILKPLDLFTLLGGEDANENDMYANYSREVVRAAQDTSLQSTILIDSEITHVVVNPDDTIDLTLSEQQQVDLAYEQYAQYA